MSLELLGELASAEKNYSKFYLRFQKELIKYNDRVKNIHSRCKHEILEKKSKYSSGGYDYKDKTEYWSECRVCHFRVDKTVVYGGFE